MKQFTKDQITGLKNEIDAFQKVLNESNQWIDKCLKYEDFERADLKVKNARRLIRKVKQSIDSKPVFALFGASQVGKSYLIKNILSVDGHPLMIDAGESGYDFLKDINPPGTGAESTGVVTRFSIEKSFLSDQYPVEVKLLSVKDLIIIFCDSYFSDMKKLIDYPGKEAFQLHAENMLKIYGSKTQSQNILIEEDILDMKEYFITNFNKFYGYIEQINQSSFWDYIGKIINNVSAHELVSVFSIFWQNNDYVSRMLQELIDTSKELGFQQKVYVPFDAVLRGKGEVLDVQRLKEIQSNQTKISIQCDKDTYIDINIAALSALTAELKLNVPEQLVKEKPFLENTDMLDFPGARSRLELTKDDVSENSITDMLLRGKIAYLFNKYSADFEINNLLFCSNDKQLDVNGIPTLLNDWISNNIGKSSEDREKSLDEIGVSPLFVIFTFFNNQLKYDSTNDDKDDLSYKWDTRFNRFFEKEIVTSLNNWHTEWTTSQRNFSNFFLLRDFKYSDDLYSGFETENIELERKFEREEHYQRLEKSFLEFDFVKKHFVKPSESWDSAATINMDGSKYIIKHLAPAATNFVKIKNNVNIVQDQKEIVLNEMNRYFHTDNLQEKRKNALKKGTTIQFDFNLVFGNDPSYFSTFLRRLSVNETEIYSYFHSNILESSKVENFGQFSLLKSQFPGIDLDNSKTENLEVIRNSLYLDSIEEVEDFLNERNIDYDIVFANQMKTTATKLLQGLFELWLSRFDFDNFNDFEAKGLTRKAFTDLKESMLSTIDSMGLREQLLTIIQNRTKSIHFGKSTEEYLSAICAAFINDFVTNFGFSLVSSEKVHELELISEEYNFHVQGVLKPDSKVINDQTLVEVFDGLSSIAGNTNVLEDMRPMIDNYGNFVTKIKLALLANCGFVNYDLEANAKLGNLLKEIDSLNFNLA
jgi:hypothetical protein